MTERSLIKKSSPIFFCNGSWQPKSDFWGFCFVFDVIQQLLTLTHSAWTALERQCCVMTSDGGRRPYPPTVRSLCRAPGQRDVANGVIPTSELPPTFWPALVMPEMRWKMERELVKVVFTVSIYLK
jgi:hypothetical protein